MKQYENLIREIFDSDEYYDLLQDDFFQEADISEDFNDYFERRGAGVVLTLSKIIEEAFRQGWNKVFDQHGNRLKLAKPTYSMTSQKLMSYNLKLIKGIDQAVRDKVKKILSEGVRKGLTYSEMADKIREKVRSVSVSKARVIARTEVARASTKAQEEVMRSNGIKYYTWITANDDKVCPICKSFAGKTFQFGKGPLPIRDTHPNCRCVIVKADKE